MVEGFDGGVSDIGFSVALAFAGEMRKRPACPFYAACVQHAIAIEYFQYIAILVSLAKLRFMRVIIAIIGVISGLGLSGCVPEDIGMGFDLPFLAAHGPDMSFHGILAEEYRALATYEEQVHKHEDDAEYFSVRASKAAWSRDIEPADIDDHVIPDHARGELERARRQLVNSLNTIKTKHNEQLLAMAQSRFDCWVVHRADYPQKDAYFACQDDFYKAMSMLIQAPDDAQEEEPRDSRSEDALVYNIYFDSGKALITGEAKQVIYDAAQYFKTHQYGYMLLYGYTDSTGNHNDNRILSLRRAVSVKNLLGQHGVDLDKIVISAEGEKEARGRVGDERSDEESRRVEISYHHGKIGDDVLKDVSQASEWNHIGGEF